MINSKIIRLASIVQKSLAKKKTEMSDKKVNCLNCSYCDDLRDINHTVFCNWYNKPFLVYRGKRCNSFKKFGDK